MAVLETALTLAGFVGNMFGGKQDTGGGTQTTTRSTLTPEKKEALRRFLELSEEGYGDDMINDLQGRQRRLFGNQMNTLRQNTLQRLRASGAPMQVQEQILADLATKGAGEASGALLDIDLANEDVKMNALRDFANLSGYRSAETSNASQYGYGGEGFANLYGAGLQSMLRKPGPEFMERMAFHKEKAANMNNFKFPSAGTPKLR